MRPKSMKLFDLLYLGALLVGIANIALHWNGQLELFLMQPGAEQLGAGFFAGTIIVSYLLMLALWFFTSRVGSTVAKWVLTVLVAINLALSLPTFANLGEGGVNMILGLLSSLLQAAAVAMLFRPDATAWFRSRRTIQDEPA